MDRNTTHIGKLLVTKAIGKSTHDPKIKVKELSFKSSKNKDSGLGRCDSAVQEEGGVQRDEEVRTDNGKPFDTMMSTARKKASKNVQSSGKRDPRLWTLPTRAGTSGCRR